MESSARTLGILLVDDEPQFLQSAAFALRSDGIAHVRTCSDSREVPGLLDSGEFSVVVLDVLMPHITGPELLPGIVERHPGITVLMATAVNEVDNAVSCMKAGASDYLVKPIDKARLLTSVRKAMELADLRAENARLTSGLLDGRIAQPAAFEPIVTAHPAMTAIFRYIEAVAPTALPILVTGETGTGKELVARAIHKASGRTGEFVAVNVGGVDDTLFSDTLFGHEKGAFTGAERRREGLMLKAAGGTIFLDEIGELKPESQVKLLRLIDEKRFYPIGSDAAVNTDARIVVATNALIEPGQTTFRKDLFYRLQSHHIRIPPLRQRLDDIGLLTRHFLATASAELGREVPTIPPQLLQLLGSHAFPGNVRELRGMVYDAVSRHTGGVLSMDTFRTLMGRTELGGVNAEAAPDAIDGLAFGATLPTLKESERLIIDEAMKRAQGNQSVAAGMLGITRSALNKRLNGA